MQQKTMCGQMSVQQGVLDAADADEITPEKKKSLRRVIAASMSGNALEWYDYALYGIMAPLIAHHFFPPGNHTTQLLATYGVFAAGFIARPIGAIFFGWFGDRYGRRAALTVAILLMAIPTGCIGILPTYEQIGYAAPVLLTIIRLLQGLSLGGEFSGSMTYLVEHAPAKRRGAIGSLSMVSLMAGFLMGAMVSTGLSSGLPEEDFQSWGWRIAFGIGILIGLVGFYIRRHCEESPVYEAAKKEVEHDKAISQSPLKDVITEHPGMLLRSFAMYLTVTMPFYLCTIYFVTYTHNILNQSLSDALTMNTINLLICLVMSLISGRLSDRYGRRTVLLTAAVAMLLLTYPLFTLFLSGDVLLIGFAQAVFAVILGTYLGPIPTALVELFPTPVRFSGMSLSYNMAATIFGGTTPLVAVWLIDTTGDPLSISYYVLLCNALTIAALWRYHDRYREPLH